MDTKVALFFLLDSRKAVMPQNYGMQLSVPKVAPLFDSLNTSSRFAKMNFPDSTVYGFSYFNKPFKTEMLVVLRDLRHGGRKALEAQSSAQLAKLLKVDEAFYYDAYVHQVLWMPRGLQKQEFLSNLTMATGEGEPNLEGVTRKYLSDSWVMNYRRGYIFGGKSETDFCRSLALYGLGMAYHRQLSMITDRLAQAAELGGDQLSGAKLDAYRFSSNFLFDNPVRPAHNDIADIYQHIAQGLSLDQVESQFRKKLNDLSQLVKIKQSREQIAGGWTERFMSERRNTADGATSQVESKSSKKDAGNHTWVWVLGTLVVLVAAGYFTLPEEQLAALQGWFK
jgi:hypothetical protein